MADTISRGEIQDLLSKFSANNPKYSESLLKNPRAVVEGQLNKKFPDSLHIKAIEETADTMYVIVPFVPKAGAELSDGALEMVAGGKKDTNTCNEAKGGFCTHVEFNASVNI